MYKASLCLLLSLCFPMQPSSSMPYKLDPKIAIGCGALTSVAAAYLLYTHSSYARLKKADRIVEKNNASISLAIDKHQQDLQIALATYQQELKKKPTNQALIQKESEAQRAYLLTQSIQTNLQEKNFHLYKKQCKNEARNQSILNAAGKVGLVCVGLIPSLWLLHTAKTAAQTTSAKLSWF